MPEESIQLYVKHSSLRMSRRYLKTKEKDIKHDDKTITQA
jgi:hypothetical protein